MSCDDELLDATDRFADALAAAQRETSRAEFFGLLLACQEYIEAETEIEYRRACKHATDGERFVLLE